MFNPKIFLYSILILLVGGCNLACSKSGVDFSMLPENEISSYIEKNYPNNPSSFKYEIEKRLNGDHSSNKIKQVVSEMGMSCLNNVCSYKGVVRKDAFIQGMKHIYFYMEIDVQKGLSSFVSTRS
ncbi:hypothetical protein EGK75_05575 [Neisseria weixii]|uniref:Lipoprotein n=1 Tax=Neisseria weixii TaxID=1853276 RepID=A0A3N4MUP6_9NEIS|nr:hypothetical protein [Neisseria weixii]RPD87431.1 hypothetical protein EGK74_05955 [Neisseria weixii]RPD89067.1 hypothetical protein EGK75_05575 [Neisseria weixii]